MRAIVPRHVAEASQTQISLVGEVGRLQRVTAPLRPEMPRGDRAELGVDHRHEALERTVVPLLPGMEYRGDREVWFRVDAEILLRRSQDAVTHPETGSFRNAVDSLEHTGTR